MTERIVHLIMTQEFTIYTLIFGAGVGFVASWLKVGGLFRLWRLSAWGFLIWSVYLIGYQQADNRAEHRQQIAEREARIATLQTDLKNANGRAEHAERATAILNALRASDAEAITQLQLEVASAKLQSTAPGAKTDANAFLDDQCRYTARGARRVRE